MEFFCSINKMWNLKLIQIKVFTFSRPLTITHGTSQANKKDQSACNKSSTGHNSLPSCSTHKLTH